MIAGDVSARDVRKDVSATLRTRVEAGRAITQFEKCISGARRYGFSSGRLKYEPGGFVFEPAGFVFELGGGCVDATGRFR